MIDVLEAWKSIQEFWGDFLKHKKVKKKGPHGLKRTSMQTEG